jgi:hypothetical protein
MPSFWTPCASWMAHWPTGQSLVNRPPLVYKMRSRSAHSNQPPGFTFLMESASIDARIRDRLEGLLHQTGPVFDRAGQVAAVDVVERRGELPVVLDVVDLEKDVWRDAGRISEVNSKHKLTQWAATR